MNVIVPFVQFLNHCAASLPKYSNSGVFLVLFVDHCDASDVSVIMLLVRFRSL